MNATLNVNHLIGEFVQLEGGTNIQQIRGAFLDGAILKIIVVNVETGKTNIMDFLQTRLYRNTSGPSRLQVTIAPYAVFGK